MQFYCAPHYPDKEPYALAVILHHLDYSVTLKPEDPCDAAVLWEDETFLNVPETLLEVAKTRPVVNLQCVDISKRRVDQAMQKIFGYGSLIDPAQYHGKCIKKPDENAVRHGFVVQCPQPAEDGWVYQEIIETRVDGLQVEYRTPVILGEIPLVYVSQRDYPTGDIRDCRRHKLTPTPVEQVYSAAEVHDILAFSREIGMDMGELDILRSTLDGRLHIIDANKTAAGFGLENRANWSPGDRKKVVAVLAGVFDRNMRRWIQGYPAP